MEPAITIEHLSKKYKLRKGAPYVALRDVISNAFKFNLNKEPSTFWALQDISLRINQGERVGIIGANGAGKSTLLKIISRITPPTKGKVILNGRVASLLEVGTGFHPELTGRENIYLNGSILGLRKREIDAKLDEIIDFSGVEEFIDVALKNYSSGMQLRLAFSVAAHLEPEILLIDEVLAVGDLEFQKKCIGKMEEVSNASGRTIVFVSHNLGFVESFCTSAMLLEKGKLTKEGNTRDVIGFYLQQATKKADIERQSDNTAIELHNFSISNTDIETDHLLLGYPALFTFTWEAKANLQNMEIAFNIRDAKKDLISHVTTLDKSISIKATKGQRVCVTVQLENINYSPGVYTLDLFVLNQNAVCFSYEDFHQFTVINSDKALRPYGFPAHVKTFTDSKWSIETS